jgi:hypothetical protein
MELPQEYEKLKFPIFSNNTEIYVLYLNGVFNLTVENMMLLFKCSNQDIADVINQKFSDNSLQQSITKVKKQLSKGSSDYDDYFDFYAVLEIGAVINPDETKHFSDWANSTLNNCLIQNQSESGCKEIHSSSIDFLNEYNMEMEMDPEDGIQMNELIDYLKQVSLSYNSFIDRLIDIENKNIITNADIEFLSSLELCYYERRLHETAYREFGIDIEKTIYSAILSDLQSRLNNYMGDWYNVSWSDKIDSLKIKIIQIGIECKQMFYLMERFSYFSQRLFKNYEDIVNHSFISHFEQEFNFGDVSIAAFFETDLEEKRKLYVQAKIDATKWLIEESKENDQKLHCKDYIEKCQQSIDLIDYEKKNQPNQNTLEQNLEKIAGESENKDFTTRRQVLAIYFIFNELGVRNIDKTVQARFIQFLTNKNQSNIYKILSNPFKGLDESNTKIKDDLLYVKNLFDELGLSQLSKKIDANMQI